MNIPAFNEAALTASSMLQGEDKIAELIARYMTNDLPKVHPDRQQDFKTAMVTFSQMGERLVASNDSEALVEFVEDLHEYRPLYTLQEYSAYVDKSSAFMAKLRVASEASYGANPTKYYAISAKYKNEAAALRLAVLISRKLFDDNKLNNLISSWNEIAAEWTKAIDEAFPQK